MTLLFIRVSRVAKPNSFNLSNIHLSMDNLMMHLVASMVLPFLKYKQRQMNAYSGLSKTKKLPNSHLGKGLLNLFLIFS